MNITVIGSREFSKIIVDNRKVAFPGKALVEWIIVQMSLRFPDATIIGDGGEGFGNVSEWAVRAADTLELNTYHIPADWPRFGGSAGKEQINDLLDESDLVVVFFDPKSKNNARWVNTFIEEAKKRQKLRSIYQPDGTVEMFKIVLKERL